MNLDSIVKKIEEKFDEWSKNEKGLVVGIDGYSGAGKTTILKVLAKQNPDIIPLYMDDFVTVATEKQEAEKNSKEHPENLLLKFNNNIKLEEFKKTIIQYKTQNSLKMVVVEGVFLLHPNVLENVLNKLIFIDTDIDKADERRVEREKKRWKENYMSEDDPTSFVGGFKINYKKYIELYDPKGRADLVVEF